MKISITEHEELVCIKAALHHIEATNERPDGRKRHDRSINFPGFVAQYAETIASEWVVARYLGVDYDPYDIKFKERADVGANIEVKYTPYLEGTLIIHEYDRTSDVAVLVVGQSPHYEIRGWIPVAIAQKPKYRHSKQPNWWVSQINLQPIENLKRSTYGQSAI
jgi:hypothetical protein